MTKVLGAVVIGLLCAALAALLFAWSGLYSVAANKGHWPVTRWFLDFVLENSVETHALGIQAPNLQDPLLIMKGAGHFETGCAPCHGAPGRPRGPLVLGMTPAPPDLAQKVEEWSPSELFWIVRNGLKYTAMPPWPAPERDDEVWAMVAFLLKLPALGQAQYRDLAFGPVRNDPEGDSGASVDFAEIVQAIGPVIHECARCHGWDGAGRGEGAFPKLSMQTSEYLHASLRAYAEGERTSGIMEPVAAALTDEQMLAFARHYADAEDSPAAGPPSGAQSADQAAIAAGAEIAKTGIPEEGVPACLACHGPGEPRNPLFPRLAGQYPDYILLQLKLFAAGHRGGTSYAEIMRLIASRLTREQMENVALYLATLEPRPEGSARAATPTTAE